MVINGESVDKVAIKRTNKAAVKTTIIPYDVVKSYYVVNAYAVHAITITIYYIFYLMYRWQLVKLLNCH